MPDKNVTEEDVVSSLEEAGDLRWVGELSHGDYRIEREYWVNDKTVPELIIEERYFYEGTQIWATETDFGVDRERRVVTSFNDPVEEFVESDHFADPAGHIKFAHGVKALIDRETAPGALEPDRGDRKG